MRRLFNKDNLTKVINYHPTANEHTYDMAKVIVYTDTDHDNGETKTDCFNTNHEGELEFIRKCKNAELMGWVEDKHAWKGTGNPTHKCTFQKDHECGGEDCRKGAPDQCEFLEEIITVNHRNLEELHSGLSGAVMMHLVEDGLNLIVKSFSSKHIIEEGISTDDMEMIITQIVAKWTGQYNAVDKMFHRDYKDMAREIKANTWKKCLDAAIKGSLSTSDKCTNTMVGITEPKDVDLTVEAEFIPDPKKTKIEKTEPSQMVTTGIKWEKQTLCNGEFVWQMVDEGRLDISKTKHGDFRVWDRGLHKTVGIYEHISTAKKQAEAYAQNNYQIDSPNK